MLKKIFCFSKLYIITVISLLICALFFAYYRTDYTLEIIKKSTDGVKSGRAGSEALDKTGSTNKIKFANNKLADSENEETISEKSIAGTRYDLSGKKWMYCYLYILAILLVSTIIRHIKGWFIKVSRSRFQFYQVHYIQLKDGEKGALSLCYSI